MGLFSGSADKGKLKYHIAIANDINSGKKIKFMFNKKLTYITVNKKEMKKYLDTVKTLNISNIIKLINPKGNTYESIFKTDKGNFPFTKIDKLQYSSNSGYSASEVTQHSENGVAIAIAVKTSGINFVLDENVFLKVKERLDLGKAGSTVKNIKDCYNFMVDNPDWFTSINNAATTIIKSANIKSSHYFHRDSTFMNSIYNEFNRLKKTIFLKGFSFNNDKWNPSDIWISEKTSKISQFNDLPAYNEFLLTEFNNSHIIGLSLKKVGSSITTKLYNSPKGGANGSLSYKYAGNKCVEKKELFKSKDGYLMADDNTKVQMRSFNSGQNIQGEVSGTHARHGKIGFGNINAIMNKIKSVKNYNPYVNTHFHKIGVNKSLNIYRSVLKEYGINVSENEILKQFDKKGFKDDKTSIDFLASKIQTLNIINQVEKMNEKDKDQFITIFFRYAQSLSIDEAFSSSVFLKIF